MKARTKYTLLAFAFLTHTIAYSQKDSIQAKDYLDVTNEMAKADLLTADIIAVLSLSAYKGSTLAAYISGVYYLTGHEIETDTVKGLQYLEQAASAGLLNAQALLVREYLFGEHIGRNEVKAKFWEKQLLKNKELYTPKSLLANEKLSGLNDKIQKVVKEEYSGL